MNRRGAATGGKGTPMPVRTGERRETLTLVAIFLAGPVIWSGHFMLVYLAVEAACAGGFSARAATLVTLVATVAGALACAATAVWGYRQRHKTLAFAGYLMSLLGIVAVLMVGLPALVLRAC